MSEAVAPVPVRLTVWALLLALSVIDKAPMSSVPAAEGVNVTEMVHVAPPPKTSRNCCSGRSCRSS